MESRTTVLTWPPDVYLVRVCWSVGPRTPQIFCHIARDTQKIIFRLPSTEKSRIDRKKCILVSTTVWWEREVRATGNGNVITRVTDGGNVTMRVIGLDGNGEALEDMTVTVMVTWQRGPRWQRGRDGDWLVGQRQLKMLYWHKRTCQYHQPL